jgi:SAM-dependent methyltransferase
MSATGGTRAKLRRRMDLALGATPAVKLAELVAPGRTRRARMVGAAHHWRAHRDFQLGFLRDRAGLRPDQRLLDLGCGNLRAGVELVRRLDTGNYWGVEARADVLADGRQRLRRAGLEIRQPTLLDLPPGKLSKLPEQVRFELVWAFAVLIHFPDEVLDEALGAIARRLDPAGALYANVNVGAAAEGRWQGFPVVFRELSFYTAAAARHGLALEPLGTLAQLGYPQHMSGHDQVMLRLVPTERAAAPAP